MRKRLFCCQTSSLFDYELLDLPPEIHIGDDLIITLRISRKRIFEGCLDWIGIYPRNIPTLPGNSLGRWQFISAYDRINDKNDNNSPVIIKLIFKPDKLPTHSGEFEIRIHRDNAYSRPALKSRFSINDAPVNHIKRTTFFIILLTIIASFQNILNQRGFCNYMSPLYSKDMIVDYFIVYTTSINQYLADNDDLAEMTQAITSLCIDISILLLLFLGAVKRSSIRPFLSLFLVMTFRFFAQSIALFPCPVGFLWPKGRIHGIDIPTIFVDYTPGNDFFFSGHASTMLVVTLELFSMDYFKIALIYLFILFPFVSCVVVAFRAHRGIDVLTAVYATITAITCSKYLSETIDKILIHRHHKIE